MKTKNFIFAMLSVLAVTSMLSAGFSACCWESENPGISLLCATIALVALIILLALLHSMKYEWKKMLELDARNEGKEKLYEEMKQSMENLETGIRNVENDKLKVKMAELTRQIEALQQGAKADATARK